MKTEIANPSGSPEREPSTFRSQMPPLLFLTGIFLLNFLSRIILAPLMPTVEKDLNIGHGEAGSLFLIISLGYCPMLLGSGFVSSRLNHRRTIILSSLAVGGAFLFVGFSHSLWGIRLGLLILGMAAGLYLPSGILTIIGLVKSKDLGKAIAIHELAPNLGFLIAPFLAEVLLGWFSWRGVLVFIGIASLIGGAIFGFWGKGGNSYGEAPNLRMMRSLLVDPSVLILIVLFSLALGMSSGVYSMMPLYLVSERGMDRTWANTLLGLSAGRNFGYRPPFRMDDRSARCGKKPESGLSNGRAAHMHAWHSPWILGHPDCLYSRDGCHLLFPGRFRSPLQGGFPE